MQAFDTEDKSDTECALTAFTVCKGRLDMGRKFKWYQRCHMRFKKALLPQRRHEKLTEKTAFRRESEGKVGSTHRRERKSTSKIRFSLNTDITGKKATYKKQKDSYCQEIMEDLKTYWRITNRVLF